jgi:tetratricopeptide repeat protein 30
MCPDQDDYKLYYAQSLYKCGLYSEAMRVSAQIESQPFQTRVVKLQAAIKYAEDDMKSCVDYVERSSPDDPGIEINRGCIFFKEEKFADSLQRFKKAQQIIGHRPGFCLFFFLLKTFSNEF